MVTSQGAHSIAELVLVHAPITRSLLQDDVGLEETPTAQAMAPVSYGRRRSLPVVSHHGIADPFHAPRTRGLLHDDVGVEETPTAMALEETPTAMALAG